MIVLPTFHEVNSMFLVFLDSAAEASHEVDVFVDFVCSVSSGILKGLFSWFLTAFNLDLIGRSYSDWWPVYLSRGHGICLGIHVV